MADRFPRAQVKVFYCLRAKHALPQSICEGAKDLHQHTWSVAFGYRHERNGPWTWDRGEFHQRIKPLIDELQDTDLGEVIGEPASDEVLASYLVQKSPGWVDFVEIERWTEDEPSQRAVTTVRRIDLR